MSWLETVNEKRQELERIADWASMVGMGHVRDYCRMATSCLKDEMNRVRKDGMVSNDSETK